MGKPHVDKTGGRELVKVRRLHNADTSEENGRRILREMPCEDGWHRIAAESKRRKNISSS